MAYLTQYQYYENAGASPEDANWGSYQYVSLRDIVTNYQLMYSGNNELVNEKSRYKILFHAKRAIQELNYDAFKEIKVLQLNVSEDLRFVTFNCSSIDDMSTLTAREVTCSTQEKESIIREHEVGLSF